MTDLLQRITRTNIGSALLVACLMEVPAGFERRRDGRVRG